MKGVTIYIIMIVFTICGCRMYRAEPEKMIRHEVKFFDSNKEDTLLDFSIDQTLRTAVTAAHKNSGCFYLGYAPRTKRKKVNLSTTRRLFEEYNKSSKLPKSTQFVAVTQRGDSLELRDESISHILVDDNIYRFNDFNFEVSEFRRVLKSRGKLVLRIIEFRKAVLSPKRQSALKGKPEGTTESIKEYFEQRGFRLLETHKIVLDKPTAKASRQKELVFLFSKV